MSGSPYQPQPNTLPGPEKRSHVNYAPHEKYPPVLEVKKHEFSTYGVSWRNPQNIINMTKAVVAYNADGVMGSCWSIHVPRKMGTSGKVDRDSGTENPHQEYEVITLTAEAAWNPDAAGKNISTYDGYELMKKHLWGL